MTNQEIALQLTLKAIDKMHMPNSHETERSSETANSLFSKQVCDFYNYLYNNLDNTINV